MNHSHPTARSSSRVRFCAREARPLRDFTSMKTTFGREMNIRSGSPDRTPRRFCNRPLNHERGRFSMLVQNTV